MEQSEKERFINELCDGLKKSLLDDVHRTPAEWDGIELRMWFAMRAKEHYDVYRTDRRRRAAFLNLIITNNL